MAIHPGKFRKQYLAERSQIKHQVTEFVVSQFEVTNDEARSVAIEAINLVNCKPNVGDSTPAYVQRAVHKICAFIDANPDKFGDEEGKVEIFEEPSESDLEDAYHAADSIEFTGSEKQIKWAQNIAIANNRAIAQSGVSFKQLPAQAKWWIENRNNMYEALKAL